MKYIPSIAFEEMSGSAKGVTAAKVRGRKYIRNRGYGGGFKTAAQSSVKAGGAALSTPPALVGVDAPCEADLSLTATNFHFQLPDPPAEKADLRLVIMASAPQSNGVTRAYSKAVSIGAPRAVVDDQIDIMADYKAVHGEVTAAAPKVFLKYFFINVKTGEKSGEMLGEISL